MLALSLCLGPVFGGIVSIVSPTWDACCEMMSMRCTQRIYSRMEIFGSYDSLILYSTLGLIESSFEIASRWETIFYDLAIRKCEVGEHWIGERNRVLHLNLPIT